MTKSAILAPAALLVIDVQNGVFNATPAPFEAAAVIDRINLLAARAREARVPVIFIQHDGRADENLVPGSPGWQLHDRLIVDPADHPVRKQTCDAFYETDLEPLLRAREIRSLVITGYATEFCVEATVRNAVSRNYRTYVVSDAHTTNDSPVLKAHLIRDQHNWAWPNSAAKWPITMVLAADLRFSPAA